VLEEGRFRPLRLDGADGACASPGWVDLHRSERRRGRSTTAEIVVLGASLRFEADAIALEEQVVAREVNAQGEVLRVLSRSQGTRTLRWQEGRLVAEQAPLWERAAR
jgi:hypothetical protein